MTSNACAIAGLRNRLGTVCAAAAITAVLTVTLAAAIDALAQPSAERPNVVLPTLGGKQVWADHVVADGWRIQQNVLTGHFRLLDPADKRRAWGTRAQCKAALTRLHRPAAADPHRHVVVLVHGLARSKDAFADLEPILRRAGYATETVNYPSTRAGIADHAAQLNGVLNGLIGRHGRVSFVTHSLGGSVVRQALATPARWHGAIPVGGVAMIAPPSRGAAIADTLGDLTAFRLIAGRAGQEVRPDAAADLPTPPVRACVIAGGRGDGRGFNPLLDGDNDGLVTVAEARLAGVDDTLVVDTIHTLLIDHAETRAALTRFLAGGRCDGAAG